MVRALDSGCFHGNKLQNEFNYLSRIFVPICQIGMLICAQVHCRVPRWAGRQKAPGYGGSCRVSELFTYRSTLKRESDNLSVGGGIWPAMGNGLVK